MGNTMNDDNRISPVRDIDFDPPWRTRTWIGLQVTAF